MARRRGIGGWFRSIASVSSSVGRFGRVAANAQMNTTRSKFAVVNSGLMLGGSVLRLGAKVVDYAGSKITGKPRKKRAKQSRPTKSKAQKGSGNAFGGYSKDQAKANRDYRKEDRESQKRLKEKGIDPYAANPISFVEPEDPNENLEMPTFKMTEEEVAAMEEMAKFNSENRGYDSDIASHTDENGNVVIEDDKHKEDKMEELYQFLERTVPFRESIEYIDNNKAIKVNLKPLDIQSNDEFFVNFSSIILTPSAIMNPYNENYLSVSKINSSKLMTNLLQDYHIERAAMLYFIINYYVKSNKK